ncbi:MAG: hypothetical protein UX07_C0049G0006 [Parcubacteria group bacterium GW2011_GWA2_45_30]|nr:MAG: hypothetical protein UX07_C0049G0006 [Parcubacteria group bacterium GW2011_GWA2_45_30]
MFEYIALSIKNDIYLLGVALMIALLAFSGFYAKHAYGEAVNLTVTVASTLSFTTSTNQFSNLTPATPVQATTTLSVTTNNAPGWNVTLSCDDRTLTVACGSIGGLNVTELPDGTGWIVAAATATTTGGNAASISSGDDFLYFRVMSASGSVPFLSTAWWGTSDTMFNASQKWAGIASSTNVSRIGNAGSGSYSASTHLNTVQYYLDVGASQQTGAYEAPLTYSATVNP